MHTIHKAVHFLRNNQGAQRLPSLLPAATFHQSLAMASFLAKQMFGWVYLYFDVIEFGSVAVCSVEPNGCALLATSLNSGGKSFAE